MQRDGARRALAHLVLFAPDTAMAQVAPLLLQPLVENAVLHGVAERAGGGEVRVTARIDGEILALVVEDDGPGPGTSRHHGSGTSLVDLRRRLALLHGDAGTLVVAEQPGAALADGQAVAVSRRLVGALRAALDLVRPVSDEYATVRVHDRHFGEVKPK